jgi:ATP-binding cassette subfamily B protein
VLLDEPFRGLDRATRADLLAAVRARWPTATLLCATHDVGETQTFDRVIVIDGGRLIEDGAADVLAADDTSSYRALLDAERDARVLLFEAAGWRRVRLDHGRLSEDAAPC